MQTLPDPETSTFKQWANRHRRRLPNHYATLKGPSSEPEITAGRRGDADGSEPFVQDIRDGR
jgi:hypothetical protein